MRRAIRASPSVSSKRATRRRTWRRSGAATCYASCGPRRRPLRLDSQTAAPTQTVVRAFSLDDTEPTRPLARYCRMTAARFLSPRWRTPCIAAAGVLIGVAVLVGVGVAFLHTAYSQHVVLNYLGAQLSRQVDAKGPVQLDLLSASPSLIATDVTLGNPPWMPAGTSAQIGRLSIVFDFPWPGRQRSIQRLEMISAQLHLVRDAEDRANWQFRPP